MRAFFSEQNGVCEPSLLAEPVIRFARKLCHAPLSEELRRDALRSRLVRNVLGPTLTELRVRTLTVRLRPRATGTIEAIFLINREQRLQTAPHAHLAPRVLDGGDDCGDA